MTKLVHCVKHFRSIYYPNQQLQNIYIYNILYIMVGGLGVACWPLVPKFVGSNPTEVIGFLRA